MELEYILLVGPRTNMASVTRKYGCKPMRTDAEEKMLT
jgi:hypothetical protein